MISKLHERTRTPSRNTRIEFYTDGNDDYTWVLPEHYDTSCMNYGQIIKIREKGRVVGKEKKAIYGEPDDKDIETTDVENFNGILRERIGRLVRKTKCFSKHRRRLCCAVHVFQFYWNFMNAFRRGKTPAMLEGLSEVSWGWEMFLHTPLTIMN